jgi:Predicted AAA-ATPase
LLADEYDAYANEYIDPHDPGSWKNGGSFSVLEAFWSNVKAGGKSTYGIQKGYITGVIPLLLNGLTPDGNYQENISFCPRVSNICGLTRSDVREALRVICNNEEEVQKHLDELQYHANGYHFCQQRSVDPVFNTQTALSYLQVSKYKYHLSVVLTVGHKVRQVRRNARSCEPPKLRSL